MTDSMSTPPSDLDDRFERLRTKHEAGDRWAIVHAIQLALDYDRAAPEWVGVLWAQAMADHDPIDEAKQSQYFGESILPRPRRRGRKPGFWDERILGPGFESFPLPRCHALVYLMRREIESGLNQREAAEHCASLGLFGPTSAESLQKNYQRWVPRLELDAGD